jgi:hypothetical protein
LIETYPKINHSVVEAGVEKNFIVLHFCGLDLGIGSRSVFDGEW